MKDKPVRWALVQAGEKRGGLLWKLVFLLGKTFACMLIISKQNFWLYIQSLCFCSQRLCFYKQSFCFEIAPASKMFFIGRKSFLFK